MPGITKEIAEAQLAAWLAASTAVAQSQSYTISTADGARTLTRANAAEIRTQIDYWQSQLSRLEARRRGRTRYLVPRG